MDQELFNQWFHEDFVPSVQAHLKQIGLPPRALLLWPLNIHENLGFQIIFSDEDLVNTALSGNNNEDDENLAFVSHGEAVQYFTTCIEWATELLILRQLQEKAVNLRFKAQKQTVITDFFTR